MKIITIASNKGGVGKTTTAAAIAHGLALHGHRIHATDFDRQAQLAMIFGLDPAPELYNYLINRAPLLTQLHDSGRPNLHLLRGNSHTEKANAVLHSIAGITDVPSLVRDIGVGADYLVIDTPASGFLQETAIRVADIIISPTRPEQLGADGLHQTLIAVQHLNPSARLCILPTAFDARLREHNDQFQLLKESYPGSSHNCIPQRIAVAEATAEGKTIWEYKGRGIEDVQQAYGFLLDWIKDTLPEES